MATGNVHADLARHKKAERLVSVLRTMGITSDQAAFFGKEQRKNAATVAQVNVPSDATWELVIALLNQDVVISKKVTKQQKRNNRLAKFVRKNRETIEYYRLRRLEKSRIAQRHQSILEEILIILDEEES